MNKKVVIGSLVGLSTIGLLIGGYFLLNKDSQQQKTDLVVKTTKSSKSSNSSNEGTDPNLKRPKNLLKEPVNKEYKYDESANRVSGDISPVQDSDWYQVEVKNNSTVGESDKVVSDEEKTKFITFYQDLELQLKEYVGLLKQSDSADPNLSNRFNSIRSDYLSGYNPALLVDLYGFFDVKLDPSNVNLVHGYNESYPFELILTRSDNKDQYFYITGHYEISENRIKISKMMYLRDGAVARDVLNTSGKSLTKSQNTKSFDSN